MVCQEEKLRAIPQTSRSANESPDVVLRMGYPLDLEPGKRVLMQQRYFWFHWLFFVSDPRSPATYVFGTIELKTCLKAMKLQQSHEWDKTKVFIWTPSVSSSF